MESVYSFSRLVRYPQRKNELLRPWDAADEYLLDILFEHNLKGKRILILNDQFGALSTQLKDFDITVYTDSFVSSRAIQINSQEEIQPLFDMSKLSGHYDFVLMRVPKNLSFFADQLSRLTAYLHPNSQVFSGFMVKYFTPAIYENLDTLIGQIQAGKARKKARVVRTQFERVRVNSIYPTECRIDGFDLPFIHHSNLFSREKLDIGTRFLLENMPQGEFSSILDLGCANGVLGIKAKLLNPNAILTFSDDSAMAIMSARENYSRYFPARDSEAFFVHTNCFEESSKHCFDLVLCNPPFHQGTVIGDHIALQMFKDAKSALKAGGLLRVIGNSHLGYKSILKRIFGNSRLVSSNKKFMILDSYNS